MQIEAYILDVEPRILQNQVYLHCKRKDGKRIIVVQDFFPFFYVQTNNEILLNTISGIIKVERVSKKRLGKNIGIFKITTKYENYKSVIEQLKKHKILVFNTDINFVKQYVLEKNIKCNSLYSFNGDFIKIGKLYLFKAENMLNLDETYEPVCVFLDIISQNPMPNNPALNPIEAVAFGKNIDSMTLITWKENIPENINYKVASSVYVDSEVNLLKKLSEVWDKIDWIIFLSDGIFNIKQIIARAKKYNIYLSGSGKSEFNISNIIKMKMLGYCNFDEAYPMHLAYDLMDKESDDFKGIILEFVKTTGLPALFATRMSFPQILEWIFIREMNYNDELIPEKKNPEHFLRRKIINLPEEKMYENLGVIDIRILNAKCFIDNNLSPELVGCECCDTRICKKKSGIFSGVIDNIFSRYFRVAEIVKTKQEKALLIRKKFIEKILVAAYSFFTSVLNRWYSREIDNIVFENSSEIFKSISLTLREEGAPIIYNDEDHILIQGDSDAIVNKLPNELKDSILTKQFSNSIILEQEEFYIRRMAALKDDIVYIYGFMVTNLPEIILEARINILREVLKKEFEAAKKTLDDYSSLIRDKKLPLKNIWIKERAHKDVYDFENKPIAKAFMMARQKGFYTNTIYYLIAPGESNINERVTLPEDSNDYDPEFYINSQLFPYAEKLFEKAGFPLKNS